LQVVGEENIDTDRPESQVAKLIEHFTALRLLRGLERARIWLAVEANYAMEGRRIVQDVARARVEECYTLLEDGPRQQEGIRMSEPLKKELQLSFNALLMAHRLRWHRNMISVGKGTASDPAALRKTTIDQIARYQRQLKYNANDPSALPKELFTGKIGGAEDDLCIAAQISQKAHEILAAKRDFYSRQRPLWSP